MKFKIILEDLLNELSGEEIYQKYYSKIPYEQFLEIVLSDPQSLVQNGKIQRIGKYVKLLISLFQKGTLRLEDLDKANEYLEYVYEYKIPVDLGKIKQLGDLYDIVKDYVVKDTKSLDEILKILSKDEFKVLHNGEKWFIFQPLTEKASCYLGVGTEWCTTWGPYSLNKKHRKRRNMFSGYSSNGPLFILVNKNNFNDKYQFHFESDQFMDKDDKQIDTSDFFSNQNNSEILYYFFPSLVKEVDEKQIQLELTRVDVLPNKLGLSIIEKSLTKVKNPLVTALLYYDDGSISDLIGGSSNTEVYGGRLNVTVESLESKVEEVEQNIKSYEYEADNAWEFVYNDIGERGSDENDEILKEFLKSYYKENDYSFKQSFGVRDFNGFLELFYDDYINNSEIMESYYSDTADLSYQSYLQLNSIKEKSIKKDIEIYESDNRGYVISLNLVKFIKYILKKNILEIPDEDFLNDVLDGFIDYCGHSGEFELLFDYNIKYPKYGIDNNLTISTKKYFENVLENKEENNDCIQYRKNLNDIIKKYFKDSSTYENEHIKVRLKSKEIDCKTGMVKVEYKNKDTGEQYGGWGQKDGVKIDNLTSLLTNYKLFESLIKFKKNIL